MVVDDEDEVVAEDEAWVDFWYFTLALLQIDSLFLYKSEHVCHENKGNEVL